MPSPNFSIQNRKFLVAGAASGFGAAISQMIDRLGDRAKGLVVGNAFLSDPQAIGVRENDSDWRDWVNWALQRMWAEGTLQALYKEHYKMDPPFVIWENGQLQPRVTKIAKKGDPW